MDRLGLFYAPFMATPTILCPADQPTGKHRFITELRESLQSNAFHELLIAVAFAKSGPILRLSPELEAWKRGGKAIKAILGINHYNTSKQALELAAQYFAQCAVLYHDERLTYHPKMYLFRGSTVCRYYIGSHNLTVGGTETNWEGGIRLDLALPQDKDIAEQGKRAWDDLECLSQPVTEKLIDALWLSGKLVDETRPWAGAVGGGGREGSASEVPTGLIPNSSFRPKPPSPIPARVFSRHPRTAASQPAPVTIVPPTPVDALVIQIVPHHNNEVFLSKRAVDQNPAFFGWPFTGQTVPKFSTNPSYPQRAPDPIVSLIVYSATGAVVASHARFGLNTVYYAPKSEIRITVPPDVGRNVPEYSILLMRKPEPATGLDYAMEIFPPGHPEFTSYLAACDQTLPSGGKPQSRKMGWL